MDKRYLVCFCHRTRIEVTGEICVIDMIKGRIIIPFAEDDIVDIVKEVHNLSFSFDDFPEHVVYPLQIGEIKNNIKKERILSLFKRKIEVTECIIFLTRRRSSMDSSKIKYVICGSQGSEGIFVCSITPQIFPTRIDKLVDSLVNVKSIDEISFETMHAHAEINKNNNLVPLDQDQVDQIMPLLLKRFPKKEKETSI